MIDRSKYASHGTFIKKLQESCLSKLHKPKLAVINPLPSTIPRQRNNNQFQDGLQVSANTFPSKFKFQQHQQIKPVSQQLIKPFLYIQKVIKKRKVQIQQKQADQKKIPFITSKKVKKSVFPQPLNKHIPSGYNNLFDYQNDKKQTAQKLFKILYNCNVNDIRSLFKIWNSNIIDNKNNPQLNLKQNQFIDFMNQLLPGKISNKTLKHFFQLYRNRTKYQKQNDKQIHTISIKAMAFNYQKYQNQQNQVSNILSQKTMKQRYQILRIYNLQFNNQYPQLKKAMNQIKNYQQNLRKYIYNIYKSYKNPYQQDIKQLKQQLKQPIIKYDKKKRQQLTLKIQKLQQQNNNLFNRITNQYQYFINIYQKIIVCNHDLFFTKRITNKLLLPLINNNPKITRQMIQNRINQQQLLKQKYLQCLSLLVIQIENDKKLLGQDCFTLAQLIDNIIFNKKQKKLKNNNNLLNKQSQQYIVQCTKKLVKQIKKQYLLKNQLVINNLDQFPADQQIPLQILHKSFQIQCTKILFKNQIWNDLLNLLPRQTQKSKYHQITIDSNICMQFIIRYFNRIDDRINLQLNKSKQISLLVQKVTLDNFGKFGNIIQQVSYKLDDYIQGLQQQNNQKNQMNQKQKKVRFEDIVQKQLNKNNFPQQYQKNYQQQKQNNLIMSIIKAIKQPIQNNQSNQKYQQKYQQIPQNLHLLQTLAKSSFIGQKLNTNAFDIRFYQKIQQAKQNNQQIIRIGNSTILSNLPRVQQLPAPAQDPLRISRCLLSNIDQCYTDSKKIIKQKQYDKNIKDGITHNYYRDKLKLENKPARWDSQGKTKYSVLLPVGYYQSFMTNIPDNQKWYLRPHHVQTLTQNPLSKKDNFIRTQYQSKLDKIPLKKRPDQYIIQQNVKRKQNLIQSLQDRLLSLKNQLSNVKQKKINGTKIPPTQLDQYLINVVSGKQDKQLQQGTYQAILYDLRTRQRQLLNQYRNQQQKKVGDPTDKWWERKDKYFHQQLKKDRILLADSIKPQHKHREYVDKLKNQELY